MSYIVIGLNHKSTNLAFREQALALPWMQDHQVLLQTLALDEILFLQTCNRIEIYAVSSEPEKSKFKFQTILTETFEQTFEQDFYFLEGAEAIQHGLRVAASLDSMVVGESQILGQVKQAFQKSLDAGLAKSYLNQYFQHVFHVAKKIRSETDLAKKPVSISYAAVTLAKQIFGDFSNLGIMIVGAGEMAELALKHFYELGAQQVIVANRTLENAEKLAGRFQGAAIELKDIAHWISNVDIIIASSAAQSYLIDRRILEENANRKSAKTLFCIDIAFPRNINPDVDELDYVYLYNVDNLATIAEKGKEDRQQAAQDAELIIAEESAHFLAQLKLIDLAPTIQSFRSKMFELGEEAKVRVLKKAKSQAKDLGTDLEAILDEFSHAFIQKCLHRPTLKLKDEKLDKKRLEMIACLQDLFEL